MKQKVCAGMNNTRKNILTDYKHDKTPHVVKKDLQGLRHGILSYFDY